MPRAVSLGNHMGIFRMLSHSLALCTGALVSTPALGKFFLVWCCSRIVHPWVWVKLVWMEKRRMRRVWAKLTTKILSVHSIHVWDHAQLMIWVVLMNVLPIIIIPMRKTRRRCRTGTSRCHHMMAIFQSTMTLSFRIQAFRTGSSSIWSLFLFSLIGRSSGIL